MQYKFSFLPISVTWLVVDAIAQYSASALDLDLIIAKKKGLLFYFSRDKILLLVGVLYGKYCTESIVP
jgi:hypothetical protein